jgi:hypothetical protein
MMQGNNILLPTGDYLRQLIGQTNVNPSELKRLARERGIFSSDDSKKIIGPLLIKTGLSPYEYSELKESYKEKEENPKYKTRSITWSSKSTLHETLPEVIDYDSLLENQFGVCKLVCPPEFVAENSNPNHISLDFEMSREDLTRNFGENTTYHKGRIELKKEDGQMEVNLSLTHTAPETKDFANKLVDKVITHFKDKGHIAKYEDIKSIRFKDFSNENRVRFLNALSQQAKYSVLSFIDTKNIHFSPDENKSNPPEKLLWMRDKIDDLSMQGKDLHSTFFVEDDSYYEYIQLFGLVCQYSYSCDGLAGKCKIQFEFSGSSVTNETELTLNINMINLEVNDFGVSKNLAKKKILDSLERYKLEAYQTYKKT